MKKLYSLSLLILFTATISFGQRDVMLEIEHLLGADPFAFATQKTNNIGDDFNVSRLEYYISEIRLEHDGGTITEVDTFWILANAGVDSVYDLGSFPITTLEAIHFSIGVDPAHNHLDPSQYPLNHPLAPKSPSMHWGWGPGYRFLAIEGKKGDAMDQTYELHSLFDAHYYTQRIPTAGTDTDGEILITLKGDYTRILEDIDLNGLVIDHGEFPKNIGSLRNMHDYVFTSIEGNGNTNTLPGSTGIEDADVENNFIIYPNPVLNGQFTLEFDIQESRNYELELRDVLGKVVDVQTINSSSGNQTVFIDVPAGTYIAVIKSSNEIRSINRISVVN